MVPRSLCSKQEAKELRQRKAVWPEKFFPEDTVLEATGFLLFSLSFCLAQGRLGHRGNYTCQEHTGHSQVETDCNSWSDSCLSLLGEKWQWKVMLPNSPARKAGLEANQRTKGLFLFCLEHILKIQYQSILMTGDNLVVCAKIISIFKIGSHKFKFLEFMPVSPLSLP